MPTLHFSIPSVLALISERIFLNPVTAMRERLEMEKTHATERLTDQNELIQQLREEITTLRASKRR